MSFLTDVGIDILFPCVVDTRLFLACLAILVSKYFWSGPVAPSVLIPTCCVRSCISDLNSQSSPSQNVGPGYSLSPVSKTSHLPPVEHGLLSTVKCCYLSVVPAYVCEAIDAFP
jgi:hypothetical protein